MFEDMYWRYVRECRGIYAMNRTCMLVCVFMERKTNVKLFERG